MIGKASCPLSGSVVMLLTKKHEVYLHNTSDTDVELKAGEMWGYGLGSFAETPLGRAQAFKLVVMVLQAQRAPMQAAPGHGLWTQMSSQ